MKKSHGIWVGFAFCLLGASAVLATSHDQDGDELVLYETMCSDYAVEDHIPEDGLADYLDACIRDLQNPGANDDPPEEEPNLNSERERGSR